VENAGEKGVINFSLIAFIEPYDIRFNNLNDFLIALEKAGKKHETEMVKKLLLLYALRTNPKLQNKVRVLLEIEKNAMDYYFVCDEQNNEEPSDLDTRKFIRILPFLGEIFACHLRSAKDDTEFNNIVFSLHTDYALIFNTKYPEKLTLFYYDLLFLLNTVFYLGKENTGSQKIIEFTDWYLPVCVNSLPNDYFGLGLKIIGLYTEMVPEEKKELLLNRLTYLPMKALVASFIKEQSLTTIKIYKKYITQYNIEGYNKSIFAENFLNIGISLCMRCADERNREIKAEILRCISQINNKIKPSIINEVRSILDKGIVYAKRPSEKNKVVFVKSMTDKFFPHHAVNLLE
jgi:hypothetical protein